MHSLADMRSERLPKPTQDSRDLVSAAPLPPPHIYELEYKYWPWGHLIEWTAAKVADIAPPRARILDYMCGTGYLLDRIQKRRTDVELIGCDIHRPYVEFANDHYKNIEVCHANALAFMPRDHLDVVLCTAGLHHLKFDEQVRFLKKLSDETMDNATVIIGEEAICEYEDEASRRLAALHFDAELIAYGLNCAWPSDMIESAIEVLKNDLMCRGEYKRSIVEWTRTIGAELDIEETKKIWTPKQGGGDILFVCKSAAGYR